MRIRTIICGLTIAVYSLAANVMAEPQAVPAPDAVDALRAAYISVVQAELAFQSGSRAEAIELYTRAQTRFEEFERKYPQWQQALIAARIADCRNQVELARRLAAKPETPAIPGGTTLTYDGIRLRRLIEELRGARAWLSPTGLMDDGTARLKQVLALESANRELADRLATMQSERDVLAGKLNRLGKKYPFIKSDMNATNLTAYPRVEELVRDEVRNHIRAGDNIQAFAILVEAVDLMPQNSGLLALLASTLCRMGRYRAALDLVPADRPKNFQTTELGLVRGTALLALGELGKARVELEAVLKGDPKSDAAHYNLAQLLISLDPPEADAAREHYARALQLGGSHDKNLEQAIRENRIIEQIKKQKKR